MARVILCIVFLVSLAFPGGSMAGIRESVHNLSSSGPGKIKAASGQEDRICAFCHTPHSVTPTSGLGWNREDSTATYIPYDSPTLDATVGQPTGSSKLCLSCHDGTIALNNRKNKRKGRGPIGFVGGMRFLPRGASLLGTDLSDDHPISFDYDTDLVAKHPTRPELVAPNSLTQDVQLDANGQLQCSSCHNAHETRYEKFLVASTVASELCLTCHLVEGWESSPHASSLATWDRRPPNPWPHTDHETVSDNGCANCHRAHGAASTAWLLNFELEEDNCLVCHDGGVAATDIESQFQKVSHHRVEDVMDLHAPNEDPIFPMERHIECSDCHNPHTVNDRPAEAPLAGGVLDGVRGVDSNGEVVERAQFQYEVCYKCHGEFPMTDPPVNRDLLEIDKRLQFSLSSPSYHPVEGIGKNPDVPSLLPPYTEQSIIYCTDCHANDSGPGAGGTGPVGPHGSTYEYLLEREYNMVDETEESPSLYAMCYKCHSYNSIMADESFKGHSQHLVGEQATSCSTCHDPHGISSAEGNETNNSNLINFDTTLVIPSLSSGMLEWDDQGLFLGECSLNCHQFEHDTLGYCLDDGPCPP